MKPAYQKQTLYVGSSLSILFPCELGSALSQCSPQKSNSVAEPVILQGQKEASSQPSAGPNPNRGLKEVI